MKRFRMYGIVTNPCVIHTIVEIDSGIDLLPQKLLLNGRDNAEVARLRGGMSCP